LQVSYEPAGFNWWTVWIRTIISEVIGHPLPRRVSETPWPCVATPTHHPPISRRHTLKRTAC